jgi:hypothetical protein
MFKEHPSPVINTIMIKFIIEKNSKEYLSNINSKSIRVEEARCGRRRNCEFWLQNVEVMIKRSVDNDTD